jgi:uncharacterized protein (DUF2141 family)
MKKIILGIILILATIALMVLTSCKAQTIDTLKIDTVDLCQQRGHIYTGVVMTTAAYCPPVIIDNDSTTVIVYPSCNQIRYICARCGKIIQEVEPERKEVIWKKGEKP